uniref:Uncharacterized protein n=1 Tax=Arion vulgaris TaxID=1028688 RepID=A0A0B7B7Y5_9EUPU
MLRSVECLVEWIAGSTGSHSGDPNSIPVRSLVFYFCQEQRKITYLNSFMVTVLAIKFPMSPHCPKKQYYRQ